MERDFSSNMSALFNSNLGISASEDPTGDGGEKSKSSGPSDAIPRPNYGNSTSRSQYALKFRKKYGSDVQGKADTPLNVNEVPRGGKGTAKEISTQIGSKYNIDPALLYSSAMEEGMSGLFKSKATGLDTKNRKPTDFGYQSYYGDKDYPVNGAESFGFVSFADRFPDLVKKGYLPKGFEDQFRGKKNAGEFGENNFKSVEAAMQAKAAILKYSSDEVEKYAEKNGITLSPAAKEFFMLAAYNGGEGGYLKRMIQYKKDGLLEDDKFLTERPKTEESVKGTTRDVWGHVAPRMKMASALKKEGYF